MALLLVGSLLMLLFVFGALIYFNQSRARDRILMEFAVSRSASLLTEAHLRGAELTEESLPEGVSGFGIYRGDGRPEVRLGSAPEQLAFVGQPASRLESDGERLELLRPVGRFAPQPPAAGGGGPSMGFGMPMGEWGGGPRHMMGPEAMSGSRAMPGRRLNPPEGESSRYETREDDGLLLSYTSYDISSLRTRSRQLLLFIALALGITALLFALLLLISKRLQIAEARIQETRRLAELGEAARTLTHEIRNPLGALKMQASLLKRTLPPEQADSIVVLNEEIGRISYLVERVREFLKNPLGRPERIELNDFLRGLHFSEKVELREAGSAVYAEADPEKLRSVVENLVGNALEANEEAGSEEEVTLSLLREEGAAAISVCDRGSGIPEEISERVFDPFFTTKTQGSGVGLAISRRFVEATGGSLTFAPRQGGGTCFTIMLPTGERSR